MVSSTAKALQETPDFERIVPTEKAEKFRMDILMNIKETEQETDTEGIPKPDLEDVSQGSSSHAP